MDAGAPVKSDRSPVQAASSYPACALPTVKLLRVIPRGAVGIPQEGSQGKAWPVLSLAWGLSNVLLLPWRSVAE